MMKKRLPYQFCGQETPVTCRREFLQRAGLGFGSVAATCLMMQEAECADAGSPPKSLLSKQTRHVTSQATNVIFLFMHGGPSHIDTFDPKPLLTKLDGQRVPDSFGTADFQFTKVDKVPLMGTRQKFQPRGQSGIEISDLFEETSVHADKLAVIRSCYHDGFTHVTGQNWMNTGWPRVGRPSVGSWTVYGLGTENDNLPAFVVMLDGGIKAGAPAYGSGFLPAEYQGTVLRSYGPPILNVERPRRLRSDDQQQLMEMLRWHNQQHLREREQDTELSARISAYELAFRMQSSVPELADLSGETKATEALYGLDHDTTREFGTQCLMARRMVERGVRFVQLYSGGGGAGWDGHNELVKNHTKMAAKVDRPIAGLLTDLAQRGLLESTLVVWGGDFGRTPFTDGAEGGSNSSNGRDHNPYGFTTWMAGGGIQGGKVIGATDEIGFHATEDRVTMHDLHGTILGLLGIDHEQLTYFFQGRDFRLTDVGGDNNLTDRLRRA